MFSRVPIIPDPNYYTATSIQTPTTTATETPNVPPSIASSTTASIASDDPSISLDWWSNAIEEDSIYSPLPFDASESGLWNGRFVPPPPRPPFWDDTIREDGLTTCDLCTWALHDRNAFNLDGSISGKC